MDEAKDESDILEENNSPENNNVTETPECINKKDLPTELLNNEVDADDSSGSGEVSESEPETKTEDFNNLDAKFEGSNYETVDEGDDRSQTPLQDEIENVQCVENVVKKSLNDVDDAKEDISPSIAKDATLNDDHGELDYEEDEIIEEGHDKMKSDLYLTSDKKSEDAKPESKGSDALSSDGELADDDDCEEGEIKEPGMKRPFIRPLCRFFTRGNCTWGINCRFLHPGVNDKGNYSLIDQQHGFQPIPPPGMVPMLRGPPPSWVQERLGKRMLPPPRPSEVPQSETEAGSAVTAGGDGPESAWERGLRHAKEIQRKRKDTDTDDKKEKDESLSPSGSPPSGAMSAQLAPPPPRDPYFDDLHRPLPPPMPGRMHPPPMPLHPPMHPPENWSYRHPFEYEMRWHRPPPPEFMHHGFQPMHDMRFMDRERMPPGRRFSPPLRMDHGRKDERVSRYDRYRGNEGPGFDASREKCEEWKDPWLRTKSPKKKRDSSSSRSRSGKRSRSKRSYSSFSSSSYSSKSRSSSSSSYSSSRSSFSSRSRSSSKSSKSAPKVSGSKKMSPHEKLVKSSEPVPKSTVAKVIPPSLADMSNVSSVAKLPPAVQASPPTTSGETLKPPMTSLSITIAGKQPGNMGKTNQLQPVGKAVAEAFKDVDEETENVKARTRTVKLPPNEPGKSVEVATGGGTVYKSGMVQGNVSYPVPVKTNSEIMKSSAMPQTEKPAKRTRSPSTSGSRSSSSHSHSSSSHNADSDHIYSDIASPISSDSPISPPKMHQGRGRGLPQRGGQDQFMHRTERDRPDGNKGNKYFEARPNRRDVRAAPGDSKMRRDFRSDYPPRQEMKPDMKPRKLQKPDTYTDMRGDNSRDHFKGDMRRMEPRINAPRGPNMRRDHSRGPRPMSHTHIRREEAHSRGRSPPDSSVEYRRVVHLGPPKVDVRHQAPIKRQASPYSQKSPKRVRQISIDHKEPVKIPIPKSEKTNSGRGNTRVSKDGFEEDARPSSHQPSTGKPKIATKKNTTKREELLLQLKAVEDAIAKKRFKNQ